MILSEFSTAAWGLKFEVGLLNLRVASGKISAGEGTREHNEARELLSSARVYAGELASDMDGMASIREYYNTNISSSYLIIMADVLESGLMSPNEVHCALTNQMDGLPRWFDY